MSDLEALAARFKTGEIDKIFVFIYSYFVVGYLILFTTYEHNFLNLELSSQILLSIGISYPVIIITTFFLDMKLKTKREETLGGFYQKAPLFAMISLWYSFVFSLFYLIKHLINYVDKFSPVIALVIIILSLVLPRLIGLKS